MTNSGTQFQVTTMIDGLAGAPYQRIWFDVETNPGSGCGWPSDTKKNCAFLGELIEAGRKVGAAMGVYASAHYWGMIMGADCKIASNLPLWYSEYPATLPAKMDCTRWAPYGGWAKPWGWQYADHGPGACGAGADLTVIC